MAHQEYGFSCLHRIVYAYTNKYLEIKLSTHWAFISLFSTLTY